VGEEGATADATIEVDYVAGEIDYVLQFADVTGPFGAAPGFHIHVGAADENGPIVAFLANGEAVEAASASGELSATFADAPARVLREILTSPQNYYVNLHSNDFPAGAVRAQLG